MEQITIKMLYEMAKQEIEKGNGDKLIVLSDDNEGNGYHGMFFGFTSKVKDIKDCTEDGTNVYDSHSNNPKEIVILG